MTRDLNQNIPDEFWSLLEKVCEERLCASDAQQLEKLVLSNERFRRLYVDYITLHGNLHWDAALSEHTGNSVTASGAFPFSTPDAVVPAEAAEHDRRMTDGRRGAALVTSRWWRGWLLSALAGILFITFGALAHRAFFVEHDHQSAEVVDTQDPGDAQNPQNRSDGVAGKTGTGSNSNDQRTKKRTPIPLRRDKRIAHNKKKTTPKPKSDGDATNTGSPAVARKPEAAPYHVPPGGSSLDNVVAFIDARLQRQWQAGGLQPSDAASDAEWVRRAYLDLIGRIPTAEEAERFLADDSPRKRQMLIDRLLNDPQYVRHWATVWSNLLVGRKPPEQVDKPALKKFLRTSFGRNRPWKDVVADLVAAEGPVEQNGAANFLVAHLNNEAVPATAVTARLFLGMQVQCTQCHNHPFNDWKQNQFWELNSFFKQTDVVRRKSPSSAKRRTTALVNREVAGFTYYPTRNDLIRVAVPKYGKTRLDPEDAGINRRAELARLLFEDDTHQVARAFVNRMWSRFFGYGLTRPVDDMGPHNPPTHPQLLERLTEEFVASGYDVKRLIRWICNSRAYHLSSRFNETNTYDDPVKGHLPMFSRMYVKQMTAEQLYNSLLVATRAHRAEKGNWDEVERQRREWLQQFVYAHQTEENDESTTFDGTVPQALLMMNSELVQAAVSGKPGTYLHEVLSTPLSDTERIRKLALAALSREPTDKELAAIRRLLQQRQPHNRRQQHRRQVLQDLFWAYLNSSEFILIH